MVSASCCIAWEEPRKRAGPSRARGRWAKAASARPDERGERDRPHARALPGRAGCSSPSLDYLAIGGGLSLILVIVLGAQGQLEVGSAAASWLPAPVLASNSAHFAASTVRLYTKQGAFATWPFLTMVLPLATLAVLWVALHWSGADRLEPPDPVSHLVAVPLRRAGLRPRLHVLTIAPAARSARRTGGWSS